MDVQQFASQLSDPSWEDPQWHKQHTIDIQLDDSDDEPGQMNDRAKALDDAASELNSLCASNAPLGDVQDFLAKWEHPPSSGQIQPNALAWFDNSNAVRWGCANSSPDVVRLLLEKGLNPTAMAVSFAIPQLRLSKDRTILQLLVDYGWDVNEPLNDKTPPFMSLLLDDPDLVQWCLSLGANPNLSSPSGNTIMQRAASYGSVAAMRLLIDHGGDVTQGALVAHASSFHNDGVAGRVEVAQLLLDNGAPVDAYYGDNVSDAAKSYDAMLAGRQNALHFAIGGGKRDMAELLIRSGADKHLETSSPMKTNGEVVSPIELARMSGQEDIIELLQSTET
ncbi:hypothetical protein JX265_003370 [Neoarthrinium moseri]|uniref:Ankyrin repeat protein n=1 Tax=Neoarthrinium moseri TaxID=1658444 RepID=A0A9P9WRS1_9PEZI|nr:hypothetical protein JX265_003370 [Neoarthrinium moseri]